MDPEMNEQMSTPETAATTEPKKPTPWWGQPRCDEIPEPSAADKALGKAGQWVQDKLLSGSPALKKLANTIAPWKYKDGFRGQCPVDEK